MRRRGRQLGFARSAPHLSLQYLDQRGHGAATMRDSIFGLCRHLGKGNIRTLGNEERVVAKALRARLLGGDNTTHDTLHLLLYATTDERYDGAKAGTAILLTL